MQSARSIPRRFTFFEQGDELLLKGPRRVLVDTTPGSQVVVFDGEANEIVLYRHTSSNTGNTVTIQRNGSNLFAGGASEVVSDTPGDAIELVLKGTTIEILSRINATESDSVITEEPYGPLFVSGLHLQYNSDLFVNITAGAARAITDTDNLRLDSGISKDIASGFSVGDGSGGLFGTANPNAWLYAFIIKRNSDGVVDIGFDNSVSGANIPATWAARRRIGALYLDVSGNITPFMQSDEHFLFDVARQDYFAATPPQAINDIAVTIPPVPDVAWLGSTEVESSDFNLVSFYPEGGTFVQHADVGFRTTATQFVKASVTGNTARVRVLYNGGAGFSQLARVVTAGWIDPRH